MEASKPAEREITSLLLRFNLSASDHGSLHRRSEMKNEVRMKGALIEVLGGR